MKRWNLLAGAAIALGATALGGGCSLLVGFPDRTLESTGGTGGGTGTASASSGGGEGGHGGAATTAASSATSSGASSSSSGCDPTTSCPNLVPQPVFCDDFDTCPLQPTWEHHKFANGSAGLSLDPAVPPLFGQSFRAWYMGGVDNPKNDLSTNFGHVSKAFPSSYASMHLAFDVYINQFAPGAEPTYIAEIDLDNGHGVLLHASSGAAAIQERFSTPPSLGQDINSSAVIDPNTWTHVDIALRLTPGSQPYVVLTFGTTMGTMIGIPKGDLDSGWGPGAPTIRLGDVIVTMPFARDVFYDNVVFDSP